MTFCYTHKPQPQTFKGPVTFDCLPRVIRTSWKKTALIPEPRRQRHLIRADQSQHKPGHTRTLLNKLLISSLAWSLISAETTSLTRTTTSTDPKRVRMDRKASRIIRRARARSTALGAVRRPTMIPSRAMPSIRLGRASIWNRWPPIRRSNAPVNWAPPLRRAVRGSVARSPLTQPDGSVLLPGER